MSVLLYGRSGARARSTAAQLSGTFRVRARAAASAVTEQCSAAISDQVMRAVARRTSVETGQRLVIRVRLVVDERMPPGPLPFAYRDQPATLRRKAGKRFDPAAPLLNLCPP